MNEFMSNLAKNDRKMYDELMKLLQMCSKNDVDMRQLVQLK